MMNTGSGLSKQISDLLAKHISEQSAETFAALRTAQCNAPAYDPYQDQLRDAQALLDEDRFAEAAELLRKDISNILLTPRTHFYLALAYKQMGEEKLQEVEAAIGSLLMDGILGSGDGSPERPYLVTRIADEHDVLMARGKEMVRQSLVEKDGRRLDCISCQDGKDIWFDVSDMFVRMEAKNAGLVQTTESETKAKPWWRFW